jgi:thiol-disulfide isomerase/thioredoxin
MSHASAAAPRLLVACLCAGWCTACQAYGPVFKALASSLPEARFVWVDIEDHSDALGEAALEIENFPTLMLLQAGQVLFYGTVLPHAATLSRMIEAAGDGSLSAGQPCPAGFGAAVAALCDALPGLG